MKIHCIKFSKNMIFIKGNICILPIEIDSLIWDGATASEFSKRPSDFYDVETQPRNTIETLSR